MNQQQTEKGAYAANVHAPETGPRMNPPSDSIPQEVPIMQRIRTLEAERIPAGAWGQSLHELTVSLTEHIAVHFAQGHEIVEIPEAAKGAQGINYIADMNRAYSLILQALEHPRPSAWSALIGAINTAYEWGRINGRKERSKRRSSRKARSH